jgi:hypothetical protein
MEVTSWLSMEVPMFPSKVVPVRFYRGFDEAVIRHEELNFSPFWAHRLVVFKGFRKVPFHEPNRLDLPSVERTIKADN